MTLRALPIAAAALALAVPTTANAATPAQDLDCAIWAALAFGESEDPSEQQAYGFALTWFVGLYEGQTGTQIDDAMSARAATISDADLVAKDPVCRARMKAFGQRLVTLGSQLEAKGY